MTRVTFLIEVSLDVSQSLEMQFLHDLLINPLVFQDLKLYLLIEVESNQISLHVKVEHTY